MKTWVAVSFGLLGIACGGGTRVTQVGPLLVAVTTQDVTITASCSTVCQSPCLFNLEATPASPDLVEVKINGAAVPPVTSTGSPNWTYEPPTASNPLPQVLFQGSVCQQLQNSTPSAPTHVEFSIVQDE